MSVSLLSDRKTIPDPVNGPLPAALRTSKTNGEPWILPLQAEKRPLPGWVRTPTLALISGFLFARFWTLTMRVPASLKVALALTLLIPQGLCISERWRQIDEMVNVPAVVAAYVDDRVEPGDTIYVANYQPMILHHQNPKPDEMGIPPVYAYVAQVATNPRSQHPSRPSLRDVVRSAG